MAYSVEFSRRAERDLGQIFAAINAEQSQAAARCFDGLQTHIEKLTTLPDRGTLTNFYSVPLKPGATVEARVYSSVVEFRQGGVRIAQHERSYDRSQKILDLEHYLDVLERKPGALRGSRPLAEWRAQGRWPASYDRLWELMTGKLGRQGGARSMVAVIRMGCEFGHARLEASVVEALQLGCTDVAATRHLLMSDQPQHAAQQTVEIGVLAAYGAGSRRRRMSHLEARYDARRCKTQGSDQRLSHILRHKASAKGGVINALSRSALVLYPGINRCPSFVVEVKLKLV